MSISNQAAEEIVARLLREQCGQLANRVGAGWAVHLPGTHPYAVQLVVDGRQDEPRAWIFCHVTRALTPQTDGLARFLLREHRELAGGRLVLDGDALRLEQVAFIGGLTGPQLAEMVAAVAAGAQYIAQTLRRIGVTAEEWDEL